MNKNKKNDPKTETGFHALINSVDRLLKTFFSGLNTAWANFVIHGKWIAISLLLSSTAPLLLEKDNIERLGRVICQIMESYYRLQTAVERQQTALQSTK